MKSTITITPASNISGGYEIFDKTKVMSRTFDSDFDIFEFKSLLNDKIRKDSLINVSLFSDLIKLDDGIEYKIIKMFTK